MTLNERQSPQQPKYLTPETFSPNQGAHLSDVVPLDHNQYHKTRLLSGLQDSYVGLLIVAVFLVSDRKIYRIPTQIMLF